ncbi:MAG: molybdopterin-dependent oxidoreductase [Myxococcales bacterium]|nr:molybdopterin-dependent oxidoreductase [Myxococcales bacterium]MBK7193035.1 molybdopterin-dependent oxidoreductase [Myxococcales bacterium]MBP6843072.1 molybdopterin-dependent oxidoreductase [Kofleriaceae bacterium]
MAERHASRTCPLCEATCGVTITLDGDTPLAVRGDDADPFSRGYLCPKAAALPALHADPDRLRTPLVRGADGELHPASWPEAFAVAIDRLAAIKRAHGADAIALYLGNPSAHSLDLMTFGPVLTRALGTRQRYSASSADQLPKMVSAALMFGGGLAIPVPDLDRTDRLLILGANPVVSNGSLMTAPDVKARLKAIRARGGKLIVIDPRRTETAALADEHHAIRPGGDAALLLAMAQVLFAEGLVTLGAAAGHVDGLAAVEAIAARFAPERVATRVGIDAATIRRLAREHAAATTAACYGRIGTTCQEFGTLASWAVDLINVLTGNLDRAGGAMWTTPVALPGRHRTKGDAKFARHRSKGGLPEMFGELPVAAMADELRGGVRALITVAGNPLVSAPGVDALTAAIGGLEFRVAIDPYVNATTRLADVVLPPPSPLARAHYDVALYQLAIRNVARYSPPTVARADGAPAEWEIMLTLAKGLAGMGAAPLAMADAGVARELCARELGDLAAAGTPLAVTVDQALAMLDGEGPDRLLDVLVRTGPYGDGFGVRPGGLTLAALRAAPHGLDLGPLAPRLPDVLRTPDRRIALAPALIVDDVARLEAALEAAPPALVLIGRRELRSNNSWMHNLPHLMKGADRCTLLVHPDDARARGLTDGGRARVASAVGAVEAPVEISDEVRPGVVSLPHGFGHDLAGVRLAVARAHGGVNVNQVSDPAFHDGPSANAAFNGVAVEVTAASG